VLSNALRHYPAFAFAIHFFQFPKIPLLTKGFLAPAENWLHSFLFSVPNVIIASNVTHFNKGVTGFKTRDYRIQIVVRNESRTPFRLLCQVDSLSGKCHLSFQSVAPNTFRRKTSSPTFSWQVLSLIDCSTDWMLPPCGGKLPAIHLHEQSDWSKCFSI